MTGEKIADVDSVKEWVHVRGSDGITVVAGCRRGFQGLAWEEIILGWRFKPGRD